MSASKNSDAMVNQGEFSSRVPPSEPLTTKGHAPGVKVGNDRYPEFSAETYPPGTAPKEDTFIPNPTPEALGQDSSVATSASDTLQDFTSADAYQGMGKPASGMTSQEMHGGHGKKERSGLTGVGANLTDPIRQQGADRSHETGNREGRGDSDEDATIAGKRVPVTADQLASERP